MASSQKANTVRARLLNKKKDKKAVSSAGLAQFARQVDFIYRHVKHPAAFVDDLLKSLSAVAGNGSIQPLQDCLASWEATAELDTTPRTRKRVLKSYADLKNGKIKTTSSLKEFLEIVNAE
ncbi:hypothetical protein L0337_25305 [candidate division KSB1 bacterium]|nr:hypothetical protein [candidate division KSB1 bacterium]